MNKRTLFAFLLLLSFLLALVACKDPNGGTDLTVTLLDTGFTVESIDPAYWSGTPSACTIFVNLFLKYDEELAAEDVAFVKITDSIGRKWTLETGHFTVDTERKVVEVRRLCDTSMPHAMVLGNWIAKVTLAGGASGSIGVIVGAPGLAGIIPSGVFAVTDGMDDPSEVDALHRATDIVAFKDTTPGAGYLTIDFSVADLHAQNGYVWFYDAADQYLGMTDFFFDDAGNRADIIDGLDTGGGMNNRIRVEESLSGTNVTDFSAIAKCVIVLTDGSQYAPKRTWWDYRSLSAKVSF